MVKNNNIKEFNFNFDDDDELINVGGLQNRIRLLPVDQVKFIKDSSIGILPLSFMIVDESFVFYDIEIADDSGVYGETMEPSEHGSAWRQELSFDIAKNRPEVISFLQNMIEVDFLVFVVNRNHESYLLGDLQTPLRFTEDSHAPDGRAGQNKRSWKLSTLVEHPAYFLRGNYQDLIQKSGSDGAVWVTFPRSAFTVAFDPKYYGVAKENKVQIANKIQLIPVEQVRFIKSRSESGYLPITFMKVDLGFSTFDIALSAASGVLLENAFITQNTVLWNQEVGFELPTDRTDLKNWISYNSLKGFIGFVTTQSGVTYLLGDLQNPLRFMKTKRNSVYKLSAVVNNNAPMLRGDFTDLVYRSGSDRDIWVTFPRSPFTAVFNPAFYGIKIECNLVLSN